MVVAGGAAEAAQQAGAFGGGSALLVVGLHVPEQVQLWSTNRHGLSAVEVEPTAPLPPPHRCLGLL